MRAFPLREWNGFEPGSGSCEAAMPSRKGFFGTAAICVTGISTAAVPRPGKPKATHRPKLIAAVFFITQTLAKELT
jgi:hypothetical protein